MSSDDDNDAAAPAQPKSYCQCCWGGESRGDLPGKCRPSPMKLNSVEVMMKELFDAFDADGSGMIDVQKVKLAMQGMHMSEHEVKQMFDEIDESGDGEIDFDEFMQVDKADRSRSKPPPRDKFAAAAAVVAAEGRPQTAEQMAVDKEQAALVSKRQARLFGLLMGGGQSNDAEANALQLIEARMRWAAGQHPIVRSAECGEQQQLGPGAGGGPNPAEEEKKEQRAEAEASSSSGPFGGRDHLKQLARQENEAAWALAAPTAAQAAAAAAAQATAAAEAAAKAAAGSGGTAARTLSRTDGTAEEAATAVAASAADRMALLFQFYEAASATASSPASLLLAPPQPPPPPPSSPAPAGEDDAPAAAAGGSGGWPESPPPSAAGAKVDLLRLYNNSDAAA
eukprot:SAG22_NODE_2397_length_2618_cov_14.142120_2_plen_396_part_00